MTYYLGYWMNGVFKILAEGRSQRILVYIKKQYEREIEKMGLEPHYDVLSELPKKWEWAD